MPANGYALALQMSSLSYTWTVLCWMLTQLTWAVPWLWHCSAICHLSQLGNADEHKGHGHTLLALLHNILLVYT